eukprot:CAMPEP_0174711090 /NCGR_PEP_ID=MMETSP1094-20130205/12512_1 /TAXON_ID=156173 /ORGANISM="Chrysochromulina brevifilum, Strain UTEX LB 985" /LENGTH=686 /DNA_ID=CAMNT_0015909981 /DNA_START=36 /DNA_END=2095 /DNA_ORIENTATION=-
MHQQMAASLTDPVRRPNAPSSSSMVTSSASEATLWRRICAAALHFISLCVARRMLALKPRLAALKAYSDLPSPPQPQPPSQPPQLPQALPVFGAPMKPGLAALKAYSELPSPPQPQPPVGADVGAQVPAQAPAQAPAQMPAQMPGQVPVPAPVEVRPKSAEAAEAGDKATLLSILKGMRMQLKQTTRELSRARALADVERSLIAVELLAAEAHIATLDSAWREAVQKQRHAEAALGAASAGRAALQAKVRSQAASLAEVKTQGEAALTEARARAKAALAEAKAQSEAALAEAKAQSEVVLAEAKAQGEATLPARRLYHAWPSMDEKLGAKPEALAASEVAAAVEAAAASEARCERVTVALAIAKAQANVLEARVRKLASSQQKITEREAEREAEHERERKAARVHAEASLRDTKAALSEARQAAQLATSAAVAATKRAEAAESEAAGLRFELQASGTSRRKSPSRQLPSVSVSSSQRPRPSLDQRPSLSKSLEARARISPQTSPRPSLESSLRSPDECGGEDLTPINQSTNQPIGAPTLVPISCASQSIDRSIRRCAEHSHTDLLQSTHADSLGTSAPAVEMKSMSATAVGLDDELSGGEEDGDRVDARAASTADAPLPHRLLPRAQSPTASTPATPASCVPSETTETAGPHSRALIPRESKVDSKLPPVTAQKAGIFRRIGKLFR